MNSVVPLEHHEYDLLLHNKSPMALRLDDAAHRDIQVGDLVQFQGHNSIMDRQRFQVVGKMNHPTIQAAINDIKHSDLSTADKVKMTNSFLGVHGPDAAQHPVVSLQLESHAGPPAFNRSIGQLG